MLEFLVIALTILWILGYVKVGGIVLPDFFLFTLNGRSITLWHLFTLVIISAIISELPRPFREIASAFLVLWIFSLLGIIAVTDLSSVFLIIIILGLLLYLFTYKSYSSNAKT